MRYLIQPQQWFSDAIKEISLNSLVTGRSRNKSEKNNRNEMFESDVDDDESKNNEYDEAKGLESKKLEKLKNHDIILSSVDHIPRQYISLHVRFGSKALETELQPLTKYLNIMKRKYPNIRNVFISTETEEVIYTLIRYVLFFRTVQYVLLCSSVHQLFC